MSCSTCLVHKGKFKSASEFTLVREKLGLLVKQKKMECEGEVNSTSPFIELAYKCLDCGQRWKLSYPDQAYRGGYEEIA